MTKLSKKQSIKTVYVGSALILTVVLTTLLAVVGMLFIMLAHIDTIATSAVSENRELNLAVDTAIAEISEQLVFDVPGVAGQEYYDYPDSNNAWLADLEPYKSGNNYFWRQISDVTGALAGRSRDIQIKVIGESDKIVDSNQPTKNTDADADGDGVGDSKWVKLPNITSGKGKSIYAAVRIIDNSAMLNVNTGFKFDPTSPVKADVNGVSQLQINIMALADKPGLPATLNDETALLEARANSSQSLARDLAAYESRVIWNFWSIFDPNKPFTPFDLSDELEMRFRYLLNHTGNDTRLENWGRFRDNTISTPVTSGGRDLDNWFRRAYDDYNINGLDPNYDYRHIATINSIDRIINPQGRSPTSANNGRMVDVNITNMNQLYSAVYNALISANPNLVDVDIRAAQMTANILDYIDDDSQVTIYDTASSRFYGFERPCIYISELAGRSVRDRNGVHTSYAIELYKPYFEDEDPALNQWQISIDYEVNTDVTIPITWSGSRRFHIIRIEDSTAALPVTFSDPQEPADTMTRYKYDSSSYRRTPQVPSSLVIEPDCTISLQRLVSTQNGIREVTVDTIKVPAGWIADDGVARSLQRDISDYKCIRHLWADAGQVATPTLGSANTFVDTAHPEIVQAHPANRPLGNIGELGMILSTSGYNVRPGAIAADLLIDLRNPAFANLFQYLTVIDPWYFLRDPNETRIKGRINVNTAPWFVLAQLPWMQYADKVPFEKARAIVDYRNVNGPYKSIVGLMQVPQMFALASDSLDNLFSNTPSTPPILSGPDFTYDTARDDFEERDLIFTRTSNLITVRSDIFTAYILVRLGLDGPQKRVIAILDRSLVTAPSNNVRIIAIQPVPDPR